MAKHTTATPWESMGIEAALPGLRIAVREMQDLLLRMETAAAHLKEAGGIARKPGQYRDESARGSSQSSYWARMTPEERRAEWIRRRAVARGEAKSAAKQAERRRAQDAKTAALRKKPNPAAAYWAKFTPEQRKKEMWRRALLAKLRGRNMAGLKGQPRPKNKPQAVNGHAAMTVREAKEAAA